MFKPTADDRRLARALGIAALVGPASCFLIGLGLRFGLAPSPSGSSTPTIAAALPDAGIAAELLKGHNRIRANAGLPPLSIDDRLGIAAQAHAQDMATRCAMAHEGADGSKPWDRATRAGYRYRLVGENVAMGQETPSEACQSWYDSPPHRHNILGEFVHCGTGRAVGSDGRIYWCMTFGTPP